MGSGMKEEKMPKIFNRRNLEFEKRKSRIPEFEWYTSPKLADLSNAKHIQFDVRILDPEKLSFPYHFHRASEELFVILSGEATLRSPDGFQQISTGDIVFFEEGETGAHQLYNHSDVPCVYLDIRTTIGIDICEYPDSGKVNILPFRRIFDGSCILDYYTGEENAIEKWPEEILQRKKTNPH